MNCGNACAGSSITAGDEGVLDLVRAAAAGDRAAWHAVVERYVALPWAVALWQGLTEDDAADVVQLTWLRLLERGADLREPVPLSGWLAATARREALRRIALHHLSPDHLTPDHLTPDHLTPDPIGLRCGAPAEQQADAARRATDSLPPAWRSLVEFLPQDPPPCAAAGGPDPIGPELRPVAGTTGERRGRRSSAGVNSPR